MLPHPAYAKRPDILQIADRSTPPIFLLPPHFAPLGFAFITKKGYLPSDYYGDIFVCCHGSNYAVKPQGYQVARVLFDPETGKPYGMLPIVVCLDDRGNHLSRPVDIIEDRDGSMLFSSDFITKRIYSIEYVGSGK
jgi:glucose/arabinose dehydrogenase